MDEIKLEVMRSRGAGGQVRQMMVSSTSVPVLNRPAARQQN